MKKWRHASRLDAVLGAAWAVLVWPILVWLILVWLTLAGLVGCSRQLAVPGSVGTADHGQIPFDRVSDSGGISPTDAFASEALPPGTEITVVLRLALSSVDARAGDPFDAVLDDPVVVAGKTLVPRSAPVTGKVVATKASGGSYTPGYMRLTLASITMNGKSIPLQTSSIFAKGRSDEKVTPAATARVPNPGDVRFSTGHRFTFRLAQPLHLHD
jgi:hypothetical protein